MSDEPDDYLAMAGEYRRAFTSPSGKRVIENLAEVCHQDSTTCQIDNAGRVDPLGSAQLEGRRQVYLHIQQMVEAGLTGEPLPDTAETEG